FDPLQVRIIGQSVIVVPRVGEWAGQVAVSSVGTLVAATDTSALPSLAWASRDGSIAPLPAGVQRLISASLSRDGRRLTAVTEAEGRADLWATDIERGSLSRLTFEGEQRAPRWTSDDRAVVFAARAAGVFNLYVRALDASAPRRLTASADHQTPTSVS